MTSDEDSPGRPVERNDRLRRSVGTPGAIFMGLGSILGTGLFVSLAIATQVAGSAVLFALVIAGALATLNGLSSAQLAAAFPVSGGTYEYGYRVLGPSWGFSAGWMFLVAKTASAATAVLGCTGYLFHLLDIQTGPTHYVAVSLILLFAFTLLVSGGMGRSNRANILIVSVTLTGLAALLLFGVLDRGAPLKVIPEAINDFSVDTLLYASALMFVAYTGYGRIATLGEEVVEPARTIPRAIILSMIIILLLYVAVCLTAIHLMGAESFGSTAEGQAAPLMAVASLLQIPGLSRLLSVAAVTAMSGVLLNLLLGLSRVMLAMARRGDLPASLARLSPNRESPRTAVWLTGALIAIPVATGDIVLTWTFSAFTVLIYYSITNLSALFLSAEKRLYPLWIPISGLIGCLSLAFWVEKPVWMAGLGLLAAGLVWHAFARRPGK